MPEDTHEDIRRRLFEAAWDVPAYAPAPERTVPRARRRATATISAAAAAVLAAVALAIVLAIGNAPVTEQDRTAVDPTAGDPREFLVNTTSGELMEFGRLPQGAWLYDISPNGARLAFVADTSGSNQVWVVDMDGSGLRQVTDDPFEALDPDWSPDGSKIVYVGFGAGTTRDLFVVDLETGDSSRVMRAPGDPWNPTWSPGGDRILYWSTIKVDDPSMESVSTTSHEVRSVEIATRSVSVLAGGGLVNAAWEGSWSPSGRIAFITARFGSGGDHDHALWLMDGDGSQKELLLPLEVDEATSPSWSPDESRIAYTVSEGGAFYIHVLDLATGEDRRITNGEFATWVEDDTLLVQEHIPSS